MRRLLLLVGFAFATVALQMSSASASWVSTNCYVSNANDTIYKRSEARAYAEVAREEGYEWGGGCWNDNDRDDTPGQPDSGGEGPDCSGFTFKTWELENGFGVSGFQWWNKFQNIHGPYTSATFHAPQPAYPFFKLANKSRLTTNYMDAFAMDGHIGMLYTSVNPNENTDYIIEAKGDVPGTNVFIEDFRFDSAYIGVRREGWTLDCYPNCPPEADRLVVVP
jgi:hypothetical protein